MYISTCLRALSGKQRFDGDAEPLSPINQKKTQQNICYVNAMASMENFGIEI
jgi:hypothetical protein